MITLVGAAEPDEPPTGGVYRFPSLTGGHDPAETFLATQTGHVLYGDPPYGTPWLSEVRDDTVPLTYMTVRADTTTLIWR